MWKHFLSFAIALLLMRSCATQAISIPTSLPINVPSLGGHFPQIINTPNAYLDLPLLKGQLVLENDCIRLNSLQGDSFLLIWDLRFSTRAENDVVQVIDSKTGNVLASVGDYIEMGDNGDYVLSTKEPIPSECTGPYRVVGEFIRKIDYP